MTTDDIISEIKLFRKIHGLLLKDGLCIWCGLRPIVSKGKRMKIQLHTIEKVLRHYFAEAPESTQAEICKELGIRRETYYRISRLLIKNKADRDKVIAIATTLGYDMAENPPEPNNSEGGKNLCTKQYEEK
jgi:hypothetical protein